MRDLDPFSLSRKLEKSAGRYGAFVRGLSIQPAVTDPFGGNEFPGRRHFMFAQELSDADPLRTPLLRWIFHLLEARIHVPWRAHDADLEYREVHGIKEPEDGKWSLAQMRHRALSGDRGEPRDWWMSRGRFTSKLSAHRVQLLTRQSEIGARLELEDATQLLSPLEDKNLVLTFADQVLSATKGDAESLWGDGFFPLVETALARQATAGWPARLTPDSLRDLFGESELYRGLSIETGSLPARLCPMSFPRAASAIGRALSRALRRRDLPFVAAADPMELSNFRLGALFALWSVSPAFLRLKLGLNQNQVQESRRHFRPALLAHVRLAAARALLLEAGRRGKKRLDEEFTRVADQLCGEELPPSDAMARFAVPDSSGTQFIALLDAFVWFEDLVNEHDEDWYRNPRAQMQLREELQLPQPLTLDVDRVTRGVDLILGLARGE